MSKVPKRRACKNCGGTEFVRDLQASAGDLLCVECGAVQEENPIVSEVQFGESSSGAATVQGAMVGADQSRAYNPRNPLESREQTLNNAKNKIKKLADVMRIPDYIFQSACGWFKLALIQNFVQGRRSNNVIAACLYVACRHERTHHLLIDFSARLQISVYSLGATYLKLVRALQIQRLPLADPSLFIQHFAERLEFGEHTAKVCRDATKIALRMSSDWIYEGRRPAGIAGACLLLAARMNNFRRTHAEIVAVAHVGEETLQKRLNEFKNTDSGNLSVLDFRESLNTNNSQPPSYLKNRTIEKKIQEILAQRQKTLKAYKDLAKKKELKKYLETPREDRVSVPTEKIDKNSGQSNGQSEVRRTRLKTGSIDATNYASSKPLGGLDTLFTATSDDEGAYGYDDLPDNPRDGDEDYDSRSSLVLRRSLNFLAVRISNVTSAVRSGQSQKASLLSARLEKLDGPTKVPKTKRRQKKPSSPIPELEPPSAQGEIAASELENALLSAILKDAQFQEGDIVEVLDKIIKSQSKALDENLEEAANDEVEKDIDKMVEKNRPRDLVKNNPTTQELLAKHPDDEEITDAYDDEELENFILTEDEHLQKKRIWIALNHDFLIAQEKRRLKMEADELTGNTSGHSRKRKRQSTEAILNDPAVASAVQRIGEGDANMTPADSAKKMLSKKTFSKKINYETMEDLFRE